METNIADDRTALTFRIYEAFATNDLDRWDEVIHPEVRVNSPAGRDMVGIEALKSFGRAFHSAFRPRIDLIDHYVAGDRALLTVNLHWQHDGAPFFGLPATGQGGTSIETFALRIKDGLVTQWEVSDNTLDLSNYLYASGMDLPRYVAPRPLVAGRPVSAGRGATG